MRRSLGLSSMSYTNIFTFRNSFEISNSFNLKETGSSFGTELYKGLFDDKVSLRLSMDLDKNGFSKPSLSASTGVNKKIGKYTVGINTKVSDENVSLTPHINFKINDDITFNANSSLIFDNDNITINTNTGMSYKISQNYGFGIFFNTTTSNSNVYGYNFKVPFFLGNTQDISDNKEAKTYSLCLTAGIAATANIFCYLCYAYFQRLKKNKKYTELDVAFRKFQEKYSEIKEVETRLIRGLTEENYGDLFIMDAYIGHKNHVRQISKGKKELLDPPMNTDDYKACQVIRIKFKLQSMVKNSVLVINKDILTEDGVFNPRAVSGDVAVYIHFKYRGRQKKVILIFELLELGIPSLGSEQEIPEFKGYELRIPNDVF